MKHYWIKVLLVPLFAAALVACPIGPNPPDPNARPPIIPESTKVVDTATQTALNSYDPKTGMLRYSQSTSVLAKLKIDDVLVSEPSSAAPNGFLRKVKVIRNEGNAVILETTQANLTDAIHQGLLNANHSLEASDLQSATALVKGVSAGVNPKVGVGDGYHFGITFDKTILDINDGNVKIKVRVDGSMDFNAGYHVGFDVEGCFDLPPFCIDHMDAYISIEQRARLHVSGEAGAKISKDIKVAEYRFNPKCFLIGPVPICVVPTIFAFVGASGEVNLKFDYNAEQTVGARIGAEWNDGAGWSDIAPTPGFNTSFNQNFDINASLKASVYTKIDSALMLYGVTGPKIGAKLSLELDAAIPRDPFWILRGSLEAYYGFVVDIPVFGRVADYSGTLYSIQKEFGRSPNSAPKIVILEPNKRVDLGQSVNLSFVQNDGQYSGIYYVLDPEDGTPNFTLTSDLDGALPHGFGPYTFATQGLRTITVRSTDSKGASSSATFKIDVVNAPPVAYGSVGNDTVQQTVPYYISAAASDSNSKLDCSALSWSVTSPDTVAPANINSEVCYGRAVFNVKGTRTVTLVARDPQGAVSPPRTFSVLVTDPPVIPAPEFTLSVKGCVLPKENTVCTVKEVSENAEVVIGSPITLTAIPKVAEQLSYTFQAECLDCKTAWYKFWPSGTGIEEYDPEEAGTWRFIVKASNGTIFTASRTIRVVPIPPR